MRISPAYLEEQRRLHAQPRGYGARGSKWADEVQEIAIELSADTVLDYGAGQGSLGRELRKVGLIVQDYDPAVDAFSAEPRVADLVVCTDVLEHVEEECLDSVLAHISSLGPAVFFVISLIPTEKTLSDGRQAHITLKSRAAWLDYLDSWDLELRREIVNRPEKQFVGLFQRMP